MKKQFNLIIQIVTIVTILVFAVSCYYDNEEYLYPEGITACDTSAATFSGTVRQMLNDNCMSCHSDLRAAANGNNIRLQQYNDVQANAAAIKGSINHSAGFVPMPKNGRKLSSCMIRQFEKWVETGMPNN